MKKETIIIDNLKCGGCVNTVTKHLSEMEGVENIDVDLSTARVTLDRNEDLSRSFIVKSLGNLGYPEQGTSNLFQKAKSYVSCLVGRIDQ